VSTDHRMFKYACSVTTEEEAVRFYRQCFVTFDLDWALMHDRIRYILGKQAQERAYNKATRKRNKK